MKVLLDTQAFLWWNADVPRLSQTAHDLSEIARYDVRIIW
jgi:PIN domain nuclease of toxin-antitoxin system